MHFKNLEKQEEIQIAKGKDKDQSRNKIKIKKTQKISETKSWFG
jgi:hypothetical protein